MADHRDDSFRFDYRPGAIRCGADATSALEAELAAHDADRALVVTGRTVGANDAVMAPVREGLGECLAGVFAETTPEKRLSTAFEAAAAARAANADAIVAVGGGSSLDVATVARVLVAAERDREALVDELRTTGTLSLPGGSLPAHVAVPTTLAGAALSQVAGITVDPGDGRDPSSGSVSDPRLLPSAVVADPALYVTTPAGVLTGSAMNGFDKAVETIYAKRATPVTDGTAVRALQLLRDGLPRMAADTDDPDAMATVVRGIVLAQYGVSRPEGSTLSILHAFGHGLRDAAGIQQGVAHAVVAPHALAYLFAEVDGRRDLLAAGLGVEHAKRSDAAIAADVVAAVVAVRDALGLPSSLEDLDGVTEAVLDEAATLVLDDRLWANAPADLEPTRAAVENVLQRAWTGSGPAGSTSDEV